MSSQLVGNEPPTNPASTHNLTQSTQVPPFQNVESVKDALLLILKVTLFPTRKALSNIAVGHRMAPEVNRNGT